MYSDHDTPLEHPRCLTSVERRLIDRMLERPFGGRDELREQLADARVITHGPADTRTIVFAAPSGEPPRATTIQRVPVDASMSDLDGTAIDLVLHVIDGYAHELEAYRVDGEPIERGVLDGPVTLVNRYPLTGD